MSENSDVVSKNFKFKELKVYGSTEWLADNKKKYRQVFDRFDTTYIYAELSFYNKLFDVEDWDINVVLKCYSLRKVKKEICELTFDRKVSKYDNIIYIREGWGNKSEGTFWKKGTYYWEAWVEGEKVATKYFYVEEGAVSENGEYLSTYLSISNVKLYEGPYDDLKDNERVYYTHFHEDDTRYIYAEIEFNNLNINKIWQCELFVKFYNDAKELKGQVIRLHRIEKKDEVIKITAGWGSNVLGSWRKGKYSAEIVFFEKLIAIAPFEVTDHFEAGFPQLYLPEKGATFFNYSGKTASDDSISNLKLEDLIGLSSVKKKIYEHSQYIKFLQLRQSKGFIENEEINLHSVFTGNPGTGKTTIAKMMGNIYHNMGFLSKGHVHEVDRSDLVGEYIGQTAPKVKDAIEKARGGVLFIDEAYSLARTNDDSKDFGREVIEILIKEMSNGKGDLAVIVAGYPKEMKHFIESNPGLKSRFKIFYEFEDYMPQELIQIANFVCKEKSVVLSDAAKDKINQMLVEAYRSRSQSFGNARYVRDIIENAKVNLGIRVMTVEKPSLLTNEELETIEVEDIVKIELKEKPNIPNIPIDDDLLKSALDELNSLIGMKKVKSQILEMVDLVKYYKMSKKDVLNIFSLHTIFLGNPGTGKTTVARILTKIYKSLGILERGHMIETDRQGLVAGYVGQTAIKTAEKIDQAIGGVLFIDEAYSLSSPSLDGRGDFGSEAIQTILKKMEDDRGKFFVFVAGYTENMEGFLKVNPGLSSRFDKILKFDDYSSSELFEIALQMASLQQMVFTEDAKIFLTQMLEKLYNSRDKYFGNARTIRNIVNDAIKYHNLRVSKQGLVDGASIDNEVIVNDLEQLADELFTNVFERKTIGFKNKI
ncbi:MAG: AAA family ATPase [Saprospiraceae bacterium]|nr:AAA family ATPase [Saprospiraceae bacterium]